MKGSYNRDNSNSINVNAYDQSIETLPNMYYKWYTYNFFNIFSVLVFICDFDFPLFVILKGLHSYCETGDMVLPGTRIS